MEGAAAFFALSAVLLGHAKLALVRLWVIFYPLAIGFGNFFMHMGERLKEERERLGFNQSDFAVLAQTTRKTLFNWESGDASPNAAALAGWAKLGLDVLYVVTGERQASQPAADASEQLLLENFRRCKLDAKQTLLQSSVLFAAGMPPSLASAPKPERAIKAKALGAQSVSQSAEGNGIVQIGSVGGNYGGPPAKTVTRKPKTK
ncbi:helix-turn-helix domain-containing protein [Comamonas thiooxydans]|uniref:helix-turn-helix domain-containing protein n=1 Tax=Comamonas thiooxydans TaxID=363952 RepID=UPI001CC92767|nr:helix-turn-helix transcriptional regulator [Comamonas thiooxydans]UBQ43970.1 helix-turn-helix domain-containing protein [Comamonas thiooxydans]